MHPKSSRVVASAASSTEAATTKPTTNSAGAVSSESGGITRNSKRSPQRKVGGGKTKTKSDPNRQRGVSPGPKAGGKGADGGESGLIGAGEEEREAHGVSEPGEEGVVDVFGEAKKEEIMAWLRRARSKHSQERIVYERFTVRWGRKIKADVVLAFVCSLWRSAASLFFFLRVPANQQSASGVGISIPCGAVSARGIVAFVSGLLELYMY